MIEDKKFAGIIINETMRNPDGTIYASEPLGLEYVLDIAKSEGYKVELFDNIMFSSYNEFVKSILTYKPYIAGFSVFDNSRNDSLNLAKKLKESTNATVLFGGYHPSACPEIALKEEVDYVITGEAEDVLPKLLHNIDNQNKLANIPNLAYKDREGLHLIRDVKRTRNLEKYKLLRHEFYIKQKDFALNYPAPSDQTGVTQIMINRGCPNNCVFCSNPGVYGRKVSKRSLEDSLDEIRELKEKWNVNLISIYDLNFTLNKEFVEQFCTEITNSGLNKNLYFEIQANVTTTTPKLLELLYNAGVRKVGYGVESINPYVQEFIGKKIDLTKLKALLDKGYDLGLLTSCFYQIGYFEENKDSINRDFQHIIEQKLFAPRFRIAIATPTSGSRWYNELKKVNPDWPNEGDWPYFDTQHLVYPNLNFKSDEIRNFRDEIERKYYESDFYKKTLDSFLKKHPELGKIFVECDWGLI